MPQSFANVDQPLRRPRVTIYYLFLAIPRLNGTVSYFKQNELE